MSTLAPASGRSIASKMSERRARLAPVRLVRPLRSARVSWDADDGSTLGSAGRAFVRLTVSDSRSSRATAFAGSASVSRRESPSSVVRAGLRVRRVSGRLGSSPGPRLHDPQVSFGQVYRCFMLPTREYADNLAMVIALHVQKLCPLLRATSTIWPVSSMHGLGYAPVEHPFTCSGTPQCNCRRASELC